MPTIWAATNKVCNMQPNFKLDQLLTGIKKDLQTPMRVCSPNPRHLALSNLQSSPRDRSAQRIILQRRGQLSIGRRIHLVRLTPRSTINLTIYQFLPHRRSSASMEIYAESYNPQAGVRVCWTERPFRRLPRHTDSHQPEWSNRHGNCTSSWLISWSSC